MEAVFVGNIRKDHFGRIVIDTCESDESHLVHAPTDPVRNRPICRHLLEDSFAEFIGQRGRLVVSVRLEEDLPGAIPTKEILDATTRKTPTSMTEALLASVEHVDGQ
jgi:hypothetical protein